MPHGALNIDATKKKQTTRMLKVSCTGCGFNYRASQTQIARITDYLCPACNIADMELV